MRILSSILSLCFLVFSLTSCSFLPSFFFDYWDDGETPPPFEIIDSAEITSIVQEVAEDFKGQRRLFLEKAKTYYNQGIRSIQLEFISQDIIEMCDARKLIVDLAEALLSKINQDPILSPDLITFPFPVSSLEIYITFESYFGKYIDPMYIAWICLEDGDVAYYTFDTLDNTKRCWHARRESYATSREIVVYEREAEKTYQEVHNPPTNVFGTDRYIPPS